MLQFDQLQTPVWIYDTVNFRIHWANRTALRLWQAEDLAELTSRDFRTDASDAVYQTLLTYLDEFEKGRSICHWWQLSPLGKAKDVYCQFSGVRLEGGRMAMLVEGVEMDAHLFSGSAVVALYDESGAMVSASPSLLEQFGGQTKYLSDLLLYSEQSEVLLQIVHEQGGHQEDIKVKTLRGTRWYSIELRRTRNEGGLLTVTLQDIHERKSRELQLQSMALLDPLTGVLNRNGMMQKLAPFLEREVPFTLYYLDLDGFKPINDSYGHAAGDELLVEVAKRLTSHATEQGIIARIGGDEFIVAVEGCEAATGQACLATALVNSLSGQYRVSQNSLSIALSVSVGVARFPEHDRDLNLLLADADTAMYVAKDRGRRCWIEYRQGMREQFHRRTQVSQQLAAALSNGEFQLVYQPVLDVENERVVIIEALLRWNSPLLGHVSAEELIDAAEHCGFIGEVSNWVYYRACQDFCLIRSCYGEQVQLSVNISGLHVRQGGLVESLCRAVSDANLRPGDLVLELTETVMMPDSEEYAATVTELVTKGFDIAIDDFGTGFSSLAYLNSIPANWVKLDREFVEQLDHGTETIQCIHQLVTALGKRMIVEGVEYAWQAELLKSNGVNYQQGYLHVAPVALKQLLAKRSELHRINAV